MHPLFYNNAWRLKNMSQIINIINDLIEPTIRALGFDLVKINMRSGGSSVVLELLVEPLDGSSLSIAGCRTVSTNVSALLDVEDVIKGKYYLEVSSPGVERPLVKLADYDRFSGRMIRMRLKSPLSGASHYRGTISKVASEPELLIYLKLEDGQEIKIPFELIKSANILVTDEMYKKMMNK